MKERLAQLREQFRQKAEEIADSAQLEQLRIGFLGKNGSVTELFKQLRELAGEEKKNAAAGVNQLKKDLETFIADKSAELREREEAARIAATERYDITMPSALEKGSLHPITLVQRELEDIFASMGFTIEDFREIVDDFDNFEAVNIPSTTPHAICRTHTSSPTGSCSGPTPLRRRTTSCANTALRCAPCSRDAASATRR